jgi:hypothetical protein
MVVLGDVVACSYVRPNADEWGAVNSNAAPKQFTKGMSLQQQHTSEKTKSTSRHPCAVVLHAGMLGILIV